jgi:hypothetical protein
MTGLGEWLQDTRNRRPLIIVGFLVAGVLLLVSIWKPPISTVEGLAWCLKEKGAVMVEMKGICKECEEQKNDFGQYMSYIRTVDCSKTAMLCEKQGLKTYPTWEFPAQKPLIGRQPLRTLAAYSECSIATNFPVQ